MSIRETKGHRPVFGSQDTERAWERQCREARAAQRTRYAVAPMCTVTTFDGRSLTGGAAVTVGDFESLPDRTVHEHGGSHIASGSPAPMQLARLIDEGVVLQSEREGSAGS